MKILAEKNDENPFSIFICIIPTTLCLKTNKYIKASQPKTSYDILPNEQ